MIRSATAQTAHLQSIPWQAFVSRGIKLSVWRDDLNHPLISGNKLHKLSGNLNAAKAQGFHQILSFGGPWSNHLHALAFACQEQGLKSVGIVRGELPEPLTDTLRDCQQWGMTLIPWSRQQYRQKHQPEVLEQVLEDIGPSYVVPEGGSNEAAVSGFDRVWRHIFQSTDSISHLVCATGTGGTLAGLIRSVDQPLDLIGVQCVAEGEATEARVLDLVGNHQSPVNWQVDQQGHRGGFAKVDDCLLDFVDQAEATFDLPLEPVYTAKALMRVFELLNEGAFRPGDHVVLLHTGGLQGRRGFEKKFKQVLAKNLKTDFRFTLD